MIKEMKENELQKRFTLKIVNPLRDSAIHKQAVDFNK